MKSIIQFINESQLSEIQEYIDTWFYTYGPGSDEILELEWDNDTADQKEFIQQLAKKEFDSVYHILNFVEDFEYQYDINSDIIDKYEKTIINELSKIAKKWLKENK